MAERSTKPYLIRAIHQWCSDSGFTPYVSVKVDDRTRVPDYRLAHRGDGHEIFESNSLAGARCPDCASTVRFEMPRFAEPPAHLELAVVHEAGQPYRPRHYVELQSFTSTGRPIVASRVAGRVASEPPR